MEIISGSIFVFSSTPLVSNFNKAPSVCQPEPTSSVDVASWLYLHGSASGAEKGKEKYRGGPSGSWWVAKERMRNGEEG